MAKATKLLKENTKQLEREATQRLVHEKSVLTMICQNIKQNLRTAYARLVINSKGSSRSKYLTLVERMKGIVYRRLDVGMNRIKMKAEIEAYRVKFLALVRWKISNLEARQHTKKGQFGQFINNCNNLVQVCQN